MQHGCRNLKSALTNSSVGNIVWTSSDVKSIAKNGIEQAWKRIMVYHIQLLLSHNRHNSCLRALGARVLSNKYLPMVWFFINSHFTPRPRSIFMYKYVMSVRSKFETFITINFIGGVGFRQWGAYIISLQLFKPQQLKERRGWLAAKLNLNFLFSFLIHDSPHLLST